MNTPAMNTPTAGTCVLYDGSCPICNREIAMYRQLKADQPIQWIDISYLHEAALLGRSKSELMQRFHVLTPEGQLISGARAFVHMWLLLPRWRYLGFLSKVPGVLAMMELCYRSFLVLRPRLQKMVSP